MSYGPRRAAIACSFCRQRKRRCNGQVPQCRSCRLKGLECVYVPVEPESHSEDDSPAQPQRLEAIEALLRDHSAAIAVLERRPQIATHASAPEGYDLSVAHSALQRAADPPLPASVWASIHTKGNSPDHEDNTPPITIPLGHRTSASNLLLLPQMRCMIGEYPEEFFFRVEDSRPRSAAARFMMTTERLTFDDLPADRTIEYEYLDSFLTRVHPFHPFLNRDEVVAQYEEVIGRGLSHDNESALVMAILALGATASDPIDVRKDTHSGDRFIQKAMQILFAAWTLSFSGDILTAQSLVVCALYFTYTPEPLMAWRLIHMASTSIQQILSRCKDILSSEVEVQTLTRLSWACFIVESDILAEFHQPRSGTELLVDRMPFPDYGKSPSTENLYALSDISARLLLNRIHHTLFFTDSLTIYTGRTADSPSTPQPNPNPNAALLRVCRELSRQLEAWYESLPDAVRPALDGTSTGNLQTCLLRLRYWSSKQTIYRAFVLYVTSPPAEEQSIAVPSSVLEMCGICLNACRMFILAAGELLTKRTPYTYSATQTCLSSILILSIAARSPPLQGLVDDVEMLQQRVIDSMEPWAQSRTGIKSAFDVASVIAAKQRVNR